MGGAGGILRLKSHQVWTKGPLWGNGTRGQFCHQPGSWGDRSWDQVPPVKLRSHCLPHWASSLKWECGLAQGQL